MVMVMGILNRIGPIAGIGAVTLGLLHWFFHISFLELHIFFGVMVTLALLASGIVALFTKGLRALGALATVCAVIVPVFGMTQMQILVGDFHWLIRVAHLLVGAGAINLNERICGQYIKIKQKPTTGEQAAQASWIALGSPQQSDRAE
jgi:hypothetical protein